VPMTDLPKRPDYLERGDWLPGSRAGSWFFSKIMRPLDNLIYRLSGGRRLLLPALSGLNTIMVTTTGAKSGLPRTFPLVATLFEGNYIVISSNWGKAKNPNWYYNLKANPHATVNDRGRILEVTARELSGTERDTYWQVAINYYKVYEIYVQRSRRNLPVFLLEPKNKKSTES